MWICGLESLRFPRNPLLNLLQRTNIVTVLDTDPDACLGSYYFSGHTTFMFKTTFLPYFQSEPFENV